MPVDTAIALTTRDKVKLFMKFSGTSEDDIIDELINLISQAISNHVGRQLIQKSYTEFYDGDGSDTLVLQNYPIVSVTSIHDDPFRVFGASDLIPSADYLVEKDSGTIRLWQGQGAFTTAKANVKVIYSAGYATSSIPEDLALSANLWIASVYNKRKENRYGISSTSAGQVVTTFREDEIPAEVRTILIPYRRVGEGGRAFS